MIKKISILFIFLFSLITASFADEQRKVELNDEHNKEIIETTYSKITLKLAEVNENGDVIVDVEFENIDDSRGVLLFAENHDEKALKKMCPKIRYDKKFSGSKGKRVIDACNELENTIHLRPFAKKQIMSLSVTDGEVKKITLPIYRVEYKNKNFLFWKSEKWVLTQKEVIALDIKIDLKPSVEYVNIKKECENLLSEYDNVLFCTNKNHKPSLDEQKEIFQNKIDALIKKIDEILHSKYYFPGKRNSMFGELKDCLKNIKLKDKEGDCGKHSMRHWCKYCNSSLDQISQKLEDIYIAIRISQNWSAEKEKYINDVETAIKCAKRRRTWKNNDSKVKIEELYTGIKNL